MDYVLIVEDEPIIAMHLRLILTELGFATVRTALDLDDGLAAFQSGAPGFAVLDIDLGGEPVFPLALALWMAKIPILFTSGHPRADVPPVLAGLPFIAKPVTKSQLEAALRRMGLLPAEAPEPGTGTALDHASP